MNAFGYNRSDDADFEKMRTGSLTTDISDMSNTTGNVAVWFNKAEEKGPKKDISKLL